MSDTKRWRFWVTDWDDNVTYLDANGGPDGDEPAAEFVGTGHDAISEGDRRADLWEARTGRLAAKITREYRGSACGCSEGTCESKQTGCRMAAEVARRDPAVM